QMPATSCLYSMSLHDALPICRVDDVIMTAGERVGPFEVESKLVEHEAVAEAGVIGKPDPVRGEIIKALIISPRTGSGLPMTPARSEEHTSELQSRFELVCRLL